MIEPLALPQRALIGVIHLPALPGAPNNSQSFPEVADQALADALCLQRGGAAACIIENFGDAPFRKDRVDPHVPAMLAVIAHQIRRNTDLSIGLNVLRNDSLAALGAAAACGANFIRVNVLSGVAVTDQGLIEGQADVLLRYRKALGSTLAIAADVDVKHAAPLVKRPLHDRARETFHRAGADALIVTGSGTGQPTSKADIEVIREAVPEAPVWLGSGLDVASAATYGPLCDAFIVGTSLHIDEDLTAPLHVDRVRAIVNALRS